ncbi:Cobalt-zinc-cadmium resistance protein [gamma proteobacterium IMCC2047]|nr:Cobalt-zinc-cadmium resistance protein [gamma proteobacterium IMCC2047]
MGTLLLGSSLITIALLLAYNYLTLAVSGQNQVAPGWPALLVALVSIAAKEWIFHYTKKAGEKLRSNLLIANAWHSRTDAFSSIIVLIGVAGSMLGVHWFDLVAALIVALIILKIGWQLVWDSSKELVDSSAEPEQVEQLRETLFTSEGVLNVHDLRTRRMGQDILLDVHIQVSGDISVSEGHQIGEHAAQQLLKQHSFINDVIYHIDAEDDHNVNHRKSTALLPLRNKVLSDLKANWPDMPKIQKLTLHYLNQQVDIEIVFNTTQLKSGPTPLNSENIKQQIIKRNKQLPWLGKVVVYIQQNTNP